MNTTFNAWWKKHKANIRKSILILLMIAIAIYLISISTFPTTIRIFLLWVKENALLVGGAVLMLVALATYLIVLRFVGNFASFWKGTAFVIMTIAAAILLLSRDAVQLSSYEKAKLQLVHENKVKRLKTDMVPRETYDSIVIELRKKDRAIDIIKAEAEDRIDAIRKEYDKLKEQQEIKVPVVKKEAITPSADTLSPRKALPPPTVKNKGRGKTKVPALKVGKGNTVTVKRRY